MQTRSGPEVATGYRPHLDGLRAVAVYLVVVFHAGADRFSGGFIGVDVFFVLSGYLVTQVLMRDVTGQGRIRFGRFYARRIRRLLPASVVALLITAVVYTALFTPADVISAASGFRAAFLYVANWFFIGQSTGYFTRDANPSPVLHYWSLAVEEQFYLIWPLLLTALIWITTRLGRHRWNILRALIAVGAIASAAWALALRTGQPDRAYFGTDTRAYQLLVGALIALTPTLIGRAGRYRRTTRILTPIALIALVVVSLSRVHLDPIERGIAATVITGALIIALDAHTGGITKRALSTNTAVYLGKISYSTYLWHWPIILIINKLTTVNPLPLAAIVALTATGIASVSYQLLEQPIRLARTLDAYRWPVVVAGLTTSIIAGTLIIPQVAKPPTQTSAAATASLDTNQAGGYTPIPKSFDQATIFNEKFGDTVRCEGKPASDCTVVKGTGKSILLMGDSNARMWIPAFTKLAKTENLSLSLAVLNACPWQRDVFFIFVGLQECIKNKADAYKRVIPALKPDLIVLADADELRIETDRTRYTDTVFNRTVRDSTRASIEQLRAPGRQILIIEPAPRVPDDFNPLDCLGSAKVVEQCRFVANDRNTWLLREERQLAEESSDVNIADFSRLICPFFPICDPIVNGTVVFWNGEHLAVRYSRSLADDIGRYLKSQNLLPS